MLGGERGFREMMVAAKANDVRIVVQFNPSVAATRAHRRYRSLCTHYINENGVKVRVSVYVARTGRFARVYVLKGERRRWRVR
jgi:ribosomal protein L21E